MTGTSVRIIHSGLLPECMKASMIFSRLASFFGFSSVVDCAISIFSFSAIVGEIHVAQDFADRFGADHGREGILAILILRAQMIFLVEELAVLQRGQARIEHDIGFKIEDALEILQRHVEQEADARGQRLQKPDMRNRRRERNMAHALAPNARQRHLDAAFLADDALVFHALVLAAQALVVQQ